MISREVLIAVLALSNHIRDVVFIDDGLIIHLIAEKLIAGKNETHEPNYSDYDETVTNPELRLERIVDDVESIEANRH